MIKSILMAGGFGTRLRPLTVNIPKPMVPLLNKPIIYHLTERLKKYGIKNHMMLLYYQPEIIIDYYEDGNKFGLDISYHNSSKDLGTAGSVKNVSEYIDDTTIIMSGDLVSEVELDKVIEFHKKSDSKFTIVLNEVSNPTRYGIVLTDKDGRVKKFLEKPSSNELFTNSINSGIYLIEPEILNYIPRNIEYDFGKDLIPDLLKRNVNVYGYKDNGYWKDVGNFPDYIEATGYLTDESNDKDEYGNIISKTSQISKTAVIKNSVIGENVLIGKNATIENSIIWDNSIIKDNVLLTDTIIGYNVLINSNTSVYSYSIIADNSKIGSDVTINPEIKIWPNCEITSGSVITRSIVNRDKWMREIFTDARITGISNEEINPELGVRIGISYAKILGSNANILASRATDKISRIMKRAISSGLLSMGIDINDIQISSIPQTRQELTTGKYNGGFHVRKSPVDNTKSDIILFNSDGRDITDSAAKRIERIYYSEDFNYVKDSEVGIIKFPERTNEIYINRFLNSIDRKLISSKGFKLFMDYSYGFSTQIFPQILGKLNVEALSTKDYLSEDFKENSTTNNLQIGKLLKSLDFDLGFKLERGVEKVNVIDEDGNELDNYLLAAIVTALYLKCEPNTSKIAVTIAVPEKVVDLALDLGVEVIKIRNSHRAMMQATEDSEIKFVAGVKGGFIFSDFLFACDGMFTIGKILEMKAKTGLTLSKLKNQFFDIYVEEISIGVVRHKIGNLLKEIISESDPNSISLIDGVKINNTLGNVLILPNKDNEEVELIAESKDKESVKELIEVYKEKISRILLDD